MDRNGSVRADKEPRYWWLVVVVVVGLTDDGEVDALVEGAVPGPGHLALVLAAVPRRHVADHEQELRPAAAAMLYNV